MRLKPEIEWYEKKALSNIYLFHLCQVFIIIVGGTIPIINIFGFAGSTTDPGILIWSSVLLVTVTTLTGFLQLTEAHEVWILYRSTSESLRREYHLFSLDADGYTDEKDPYDKNKLFIERVELESILAGVAGGEFDQKQIDWLKEELANAPKDEAVIICVHHPAFSLDIHHSGSRSNTKYSRYIIPRVRTYSRYCTYSTCSQLSTIHTSIRGPTSTIYSSRGWRVLEFASYAN